jgi:hypothetical protein
MERLFSNVTQKLKVGPFVRAFGTLEIPLTHWKCHIEAVYFIKQNFIKESYM